MRAAVQEPEGATAQCVLLDFVQKSIKRQSIVFSDVDLRRRELKEARLLAMIEQMWL